MKGKTVTPNNLRELPNIGNHTCFACSPRNELGLQMKLYTDEAAVYSWLAVPGHMGGWHDIIHGGIVSTILDEIMGWAGLYLLKKVTLTQSMTIDFLKAVHTGQMLRAEGRVVNYDGGRSALAEGFLYDQKDELCARSKGDFTVLAPKVAARIGVMTEDQIKAFLAPLG